MDVLTDRIPACAKYLADLTESEKSIMVKINGQFFAFLKGESCVLLLQQHRELILPASIRHTSGCYAVAHQTG